MLFHGAVKVPQFYNSRKKSSSPRLPHQPARTENRHTRQQCCVCSAGCRVVDQWYGKSLLGSSYNETIVNLTRLHDPSAQTRLLENIVCVQRHCKRPSCHWAIKNQLQNDVMRFSYSFFSSPDEKKPRQNISDR